MTYTPEFEQFWSAYPRKKSKIACFKKWEIYKKNGDLPPIETLLKAIELQKKERAFLKSQNRFVPEWKHASTWLNQGCREDDCEVNLQVARTEPKRIGNGLDNMVRALNILTNISEARFNEFCAAVKMPKADIEAVRYKYEGRFPDPKQLVRSIG